MAHGDDSEAWRGGESKPPQGGFFAMFGEPREMTDEEKEQLKAHIAERRADAALRALILPALNLAATCVKCGGTKIELTYCSGGTEDRDVMHPCFLDTAGQEHMHRTCEQCGFRWIEKTLDAAGIA